MIHLSQNSSTRGASEVIGFVILVGLAVVMSVFVVAAAQGGPISSLQERSANEQVKNTFSQISSSSVGAAVGGQNTSETVPTPFASTSNPIEISEQGSITVKSYENSSDTTGDLVFQEDVGYIKYKTGNGDKTMYYQNGAVWRIYENGGVETVTSPEFHYNIETLTLPIIKLKANTDTATNELSFNHKSTSRSTEQLATDDKILRVTIEGPTYQGWGSYFESRFPPEVVDYNHEAESVTVTLGTAPTTYNTIGDEIVTLEGTLSTQGNNSISGDIIENASKDLPPADNTIDDQKDYAQTSGTTLSSLDGKTLDDGGDYYVSSADIDNGVTVDLSDGDVTLVIDGNIDINSGSIEVINSDGGENQLKTYLEGDLYMATYTSWVVDGSDKGANVLYASSTSEFRTQPHTTFEGVYYAPGGGGSTSNTSGSPSDGNNGGESDCGPGTALCMQPQSTIEGAIIADSADLQPNTTLDFDSSLTDFKLDSQTSATDVRPELSYLHTSTTVVEVDDKDD